MSPQYIKVPLKRLRDLGCDEKWVQDRISDDPTILGIGDVKLIERERILISGGRLDILLADPEEGIRFEVEVMLGELDESHIIRSIEYWDIERRRYPSFQHRAVIIAEDITNRFYNVISLFNKSVPIIALQMGAFDVEGKVALTFTKVLDIAETFDEPDEPGQEQVDRSSWEKPGYAIGLKVFDEIVNVLNTLGRPPKIRYASAYIAISGEGTKNYGWLSPRKGGGRCYCEFLIGQDAMQDWLNRLEKSTIGDIRHGKRYVKFSVNADCLEKNKEIVTELIKCAEEFSRK